MNLAVPRTKLSPPDLRAHLHRERLYARLDEAAPAAWVSGPPGAGKTSLAAGYIAARERRPLWYRLDEADAGDLETFFLFFEHAARASAEAGGGGGSDRDDAAGVAEPWSASLPTGARGRALDAFARRYFRRLFARLEPRVLVVEDLHVLDDDDPLHRVVVVALQELPDGWAALLTSRADAPPTYARLRVSGRLLEVPPEALVFDEQETGALLSLATGLDAPPAAARAIRGQVQGWAAGLTLVMASPPGTRSSETSRRAIFDYFASEVLSVMDEQVRRLLVCTPMVGELDAALARELSGVEGSESILDDLAARGYFVTRRSHGRGGGGGGGGGAREGAAEAVYRYHPLFRTFLLRFARERLKPHRFRELLERAAAGLEQRGNVEPALALWVELEGWDAFEAGLARHAEMLLARGRPRRLHATLSRVPEAQRGGWTWLALGTAERAADAAAGVEAFERARAAFADAESAAGWVRATHALVEALIAGQREVARLDELCGELAARVDDLAAANDRVLALAALGRACAARPQAHPESALWMQRALDVVAQLPDTATAAELARELHRAFALGADQARRVAALDALRALVAPDTEPAAGRRPERGDAGVAQAVVFAELARGLEEWIVGDLDGARTRWHAALTRCEEGSADAGIALRNAAIGALCDGDGAAADAHLAALRGALAPGRDEDAFFARYLGGWRHQLAGEWSRASGELTQALEHAGPEGMDAEAFVQLSRAALAVCAEQLGDRAVADEHLAASLEGAAGLPLVVAQLAAAEVTLARGDADAAAAQLAEALAGARRGGVWCTLGWRRDAMAALCAVALDRGVETDFVSSLLKRHALAPPRGGSAARVLERWPFRVRLRVLGGLEIELAGEPVTFKGKAPKKPLELLAALCLSGPERASESRLGDMLWPDSDGAAAIQALATTLHRLRKIVGDDVATRQQGAVALDRDRVWVDLWQVRQLLRAHGDPVAFERALALLRGALLAGLDDIWVESGRQALRDLLVESAVALTSANAGADERVLSLQARALEHVPHAERLYQVLIGGYGALGLRAEAVAIYRRCCEVLDRDLGIDPSAATRRAYEVATE